MGTCQIIYERLYVTAISFKDRFLYLKKYWLRICKMNKYKYQFKITWSSSKFFQFGWKFLGLIIKCTFVTKTKFVKRWDREMELLSWIDCSSTLLYVSINFHEDVMGENEADRCIYFYDRLRTWQPWRIILQAPLVQLRQMLASSMLIMKWQAETSSSCLKVNYWQTIKLQNFWK